MGPGAVRRWESGGSFSCTAALRPAPWVRMRTPRTSAHQRNQRGGAVPFALVASVAAALFVAAILLRGLEAPVRVAPEQREERPTIASPMQLLGVSGSRRSAELAALLPEALRGPWQRVQTGLAAQQACPKTIEWLATPRGQELERTLAELGRGDAPQGLAAAMLLVDLARRTQWEPGMFLGAEHSERIGDLMQAWLARFAEKSADDVTLHEPALAVFLLYGRVMREAYDAPTFGRSQAPFERARSFVRGLCGTVAKSQTDFGRALQTRHPRAYLGLLEDDFLAGCDEEARLLFPDIDGDCGK